MFVVPIVKCIGLALGLLVWGGTNMLAGWASGRFGLFGLAQQEPSNVPVNYVAIAVAICSLAVSSFVKTDPTAGSAGRKGSDSDAHRDDDDVVGGRTSASSTGAAASARRGKNGEGRDLGYGEEGDDEEGSMLPHSRLLGEDSATTAASHIAFGSSLNKVGAPADEDEASWTDKLSPWQKRVFGFGGSLFSGLLYGTCFNPPQYVVDHPSAYPGSSDNLIDYVFPQFCGIYLTSTFFLLLYTAYTRNLPQVNPQVILPTFVSGTMWAIAQTCWFIANANLDFVVSFPLIAMGPGLVAAAWGVFVFGEIRGLRNFLFLGATFTISIIAAVLIVISGPKS